MQPIRSLWTPTLSICAYVYIYIYIYICIYAYMHTCIFAYMYVCMYVCMYLCIYVSMYLYIYVSMYTCIYVYMYTCIHAYLRMFVHMLYKGSVLRKARERPTEHDSCLLLSSGASAQNSTPAHERGTLSCSSGGPWGKLKTKFILPGRGQTSGLGSL